MRIVLWASGFVGDFGERGLGMGPERAFCERAQCGRELRERSIVRRELQAMQYAMHSLLVTGSLE
jgi:hypothetical protein